MSDRSVYRSLQKHLDRQPVGFPPTLTGADIRLLRHFFSPREAEAALGLSHRFGTVEDAALRLGDAAPLPDELKATLEGLAARGVIASRKDGGTAYYALLPLVVGMYETRVKNLSKDFLKDFSSYSSSPLFGIDLIGIDPPQMRTIPIGETVTPESHRPSLDDVSSIIETIEGPFAVLECICRKAAALKGRSCSMISRNETCLALGDMAHLSLTSGIGREVSKEETLEILSLNVEEGLVIQPSNTQELAFVCSCCGCCCGMLRVHRLLDGSVKFLATGFHALVNGEVCSSCGLCLEACQVGAIDIAGNTARVNPSLCIGCGHCVRACPQDAIGLYRNGDHEETPETIDDLYEMIRSRKKGPREKLALAARVLLRAPAGLMRRKRQG